MFVMLIALCFIFASDCCVAMTAREKAERNARGQIRSPGRAHLGGISNGTHEGVGYGSSARDALASCCYTGRRKYRCTDSAVVQGPRGGWYAVKQFIYRRR